MSELEQKQTRNQSGYMARPGRIDRSMPKPAHDDNPLLAQQQALGNQAMQRFAETCPLTLPSASICPFGGVCHTCPARAQPKLKISQPGDKYEQEANRVANEVMHMPDPNVPDRSQFTSVSSIPHIQRLCPECEEKLQRQPEEEEEEELLQTKEISGQIPEVNSSLEANINSILSGGQPLPDSVRDYFEPRFGYDFSNVRVHTDNRAAQAAGSVNAQAFTLGHDMAFAPGQYTPGTDNGLLLMAHELVHVIQQGVFAPTMIQRACGPTAIGEPSGCTGLGGDAFGHIFHFSVGCDTFLNADEEDALRDFALIVESSDRLVIHGFASEEGPEAFNDHLSCARALKAKAILMEEGVFDFQVDEIYKHGTTPGPRTDRRSIVIQFVTRPTVPTTTPTPTPRPEGEVSGCFILGHDISICGSNRQIMEQLFGLEENSLTHFLNCFCGIAGVVDLFDASPFLFVASPWIEGIDCLCNVWTTIQNFVQRGIEGDCWAPCNYSFRDVGDVAALAALTYVDCASLPLGTALATTIGGLIGGGGGTAVEPVGGTLVGGAVGVALGAAVGDFIIDVAAMALQNMITQGTPWPMGQCCSCVELARAVGVDVDPQEVCRAIFPVSEERTEAICG